MYFQFLIEDASTKILVEHVMKKLVEIYSEDRVQYGIKFFKGIGNLTKKGSAIEQKTGKLLNDLPLFLRAFDKKFRGMTDVAIFVVLDNDKRDKIEFRKQLEEISRSNMILSDHVFCIAVKEMEAWLLGDVQAIEKAYPRMKKSAIRKYTQDGICDTWEVLADMVCTGGLKGLKKKAGTSYNEIGKAKAEWADKIGQNLDLGSNMSPSFQYFVSELKMRIAVA